ncbi:MULTISPECIES: PTS sugar transporter subunit IIA [Klebsiella]|uniref:Uncharacterized protein n=1 Tax=Klebsiella pneumoniae TaxID=573 RepID=A0A6B2I5N9_KLEPN|nr:MULTISPECIES: hypothetical protein [Klebsiella]EKH6437595.1 hypothetical protein [Klebsiella oxytoca]HBX3543957.1 hypothetical protein [Klebsiella pneumoniae subsp. pneumoniae]EIV5818076.1 hypothetical protein [Klebsiella pneumoniae]EKJ7590133.1 hypothetical protein [Klebsiella oxytoca]EKT8694401.1 hypothetical protein [Klebsiella pneumoniae]
MENITGVIVVTHGDLASAILETCEMLIGKHSHTSAVCYLPEHSPDVLHRNLSAAISEMKGYSGILILCDMKGGSPCNVAMLLARKNERLKIITGVNIPVLVEAITISMDTPLEQVMSDLQHVVADAIEIL